MDDGYNNTYSNASDSLNYNFYDFAIINNSRSDYHIKNNYFNFVKIPNIFIRKNIYTEYGLNRIFLIPFIMINRNRTYEDKSHITIGQVMDYCGYKKSTHKPKVFFEIIKSILFLVENNYIEASFDPYRIGYDDSIEINIISKNFDVETDFTKFANKDFDKIFKIDSTPTKESLLVCYLYIKSYIIQRKRDKDGNELSDHPCESPEAFYRSIENMAKELSMSKDTINQCIDYLTTSSDNRTALLIKREVGSVKVDKNRPPKNVPNIYVLNKSGYQQEIEWALMKMMEIYKVDEFDSQKSGNFKNQTEK